MFLNESVDKNLAYMQFIKVSKCKIVFSYNKQSFFNIYLFFERGRQSMSRGGAEREGDPESEAGSRLRAVSTEPNMGLNS